ncbi:MAG: hypothetical protein PVI73_08660, partial [Syntrophobacterales bacterium]
QPAHDRFPVHLITVYLTLCALRLALCVKGAVQSRACRAVALAKAGPLGPDSLLLWHGILVTVKVGS